MTWNVKITSEAKSELKKIGKSDAQRILAFLFDRIQNRENPREIGKPLKGIFHEFWRYRVGDYRILCRIEDETITVFVVHCGHRSEVYKRS